MNHASSLRQRQQTISWTCCLFLIQGLEMLVGRYLNQEVVPRKLPKTRPWWWELSLFHCVLLRVYYFRLACFRTTSDIRLLYLSALVPQLCWPVMSHPRPYLSVLLRFLIFRRDYRTPGCGKSYLTSLSNATSPSQYKHATTCQEEVN